MYLEANDVKIEDVMEELNKREKMSYDDNNIFAKILEEKFLVKKFMKMNLFYLFMILILKKKIHALVIPKGKYVDLDDFSQNASNEMVGLIKGINIVAKKLRNFCRYW